MNRIASTLGTALALCVAGHAASANTLDLAPDFPQLTFNNTGVTTFDASTDTLSVTATPLAVRFEDGGFPAIVRTDAGMMVRSVEMNVRFDDDGALLGGVPGPDFIVIGEIDADFDGVPEFSGVLLEGEVTEASCFEEVALVANQTRILKGMYRGTKSAKQAKDITEELTDSLFSRAVTLFEFRFTPTGGSLTELYPEGDDMGVALTVENSTFTGDFTTNFSGGAKGFVGPIDGLTGGCCLDDGTCIDVTEAECLAEEGEFQGVGNTCDNITGFIYDRVEGEFSQNDGAGRVQEYAGTYLPNAQRFIWDVTFSPGPGDCLPTAYTLVINDGPNPKGIPGELAILYADFSGSAFADPVLSAYVYNGRNGTEGINSFRDGDGNPNNDPDGDLIVTSLKDDFVNSIQLIDNPDGTRRLLIDIDTTEINAHSPIFPDPNGDFEGVQFDERVGVWFHPHVLTNVEYEDNCRLAAFDVGKTGWVDTANDHAESFGCVPKPRCVLHFTFDEQQGETVSDEDDQLTLWIHNDYEGSATGAVSWITDPHCGTGLKFEQDPLGDAVAKTADDNDADFLLDAFAQTDAITVQVVFEIGHLRNDSRLFSWSSSTSMSDRNVSLISDGHDNTSGNHTSTARTRLVTDSGQVEEESWDVFNKRQCHVYTITYDGNDEEILSVYVDGQLYETESNFHGGLDFVSRHVLLGNELHGDRPFDGVLYDVKLWNAALDADTVQDLAEEALGL